MSRMTDRPRAEIANHPWTFILGFMLGVIASLVFLIAVLALDYISRGA